MLPLSLLTHTQKSSIPNFCSVIIYHHHPSLRSTSIHSSSIDGQTPSSSLIEEEGASATGTSQDTPSSSSSSTPLSSTDTHDDTHDDVGDVRGRWARLEAEGSLLRGLQCGVTMLQARQADACLRVARLGVLAATNLCEDLLVTWRARVAAKSQAFRLPLPRLFLSHVPGLGEFASE